MIMFSTQIEYPSVSVDGCFGSSGATAFLGAGWLSMGMGMGMAMATATVMLKGVREWRGKK